jgi:hypothetical protein
MKLYIFGIISLFSVSHADITQFMTFGEWTKNQKIDFAQKCLWSESIQKLGVHQGEMKCVDTANVLSIVYPKYEEISKLNKQEFNELISKY